MFESLYATHQTVTFRVQDALILRDYPGSTFRGALGYAFKRVSCALTRKQCETCLLRERCAYSVCFETPVPRQAEIMRKYPYAPHPFVLEPPAGGRRYEPGEELALGLVLVGRGNDYLPQFIYAFEELGKQGLGRDRAKLELVSLAAGDGDHWRIFYNHAEQKLAGNAETVDAEAIGRAAACIEGQPLRIAFETPARVKVGGNYSATGELGDLVPGLLRRLTTLSYFHCGGPEDNDVRPIIEAARRATMRSATVEWVDWERYSGRQQTAMQLGGFTGAAEYEPVAGELLPILLWGALVHIGKATAFGLGKYRVEGLGERVEG
jgi:hypothetical protein